MGSKEFKRLWKETQVVIIFVIICIILGFTINCHAVVYVGLAMLIVMGIVLVYSKLVDSIVENE